MELSRLDYALMKVLQSRDCTTFFSGMTLHELRTVVSMSKSAVYRKLIQLIDDGYIEKGCKSINADTFYITEKGMHLIEAMGGVIKDAEG